MKTNMILEIIMQCSIVLVQGFYFIGVYFSKNSFSFLVFKNTDIKLGKGAANIADVIDFFGMSNYISGLNAVFIACAVALLVINNPWKPFMVWCETEPANIENVSRFIRIGAIAMYFFAIYAIAY